jgi:hypothetical protein
MFWTVLLYSYLITTGISIIVMPIRTYHMGKEKYGKRKAVMVAFQIAGCCLVPYVGFCAMVYAAMVSSKRGLKGWVKDDPTSPKNLSDPDFVPPPKKVKKAKPIDSRFDIMDL